MPNQKNTSQLDEINGKRFHPFFTKRLAKKQIPFIFRKPPYISPRLLCKQYSLSIHLKQQMRRSCKRSVSWLDESCVKASSWRNSFTFDAGIVFGMLSGTARTLCRLGPRLLSIQKRHVLRFDWADSAFGYWKQKVEMKERCLPFNETIILFFFATIVMTFGWKKWGSTF